MKFFNLKCEVPGGLGPETIYNKSIVPWKMEHPHIILDGWMGGELLTVSGCLFASDNLMKKLMFDYSGIIAYETFQLTKSATFIALQPKIEFPKFIWLRVGSRPFVDDIALTCHNNLYNQLIISEHLWKTLSEFELGIFRIEEAVGDLG